jgi:hypothetical protein
MYPVLTQVVPRHRVISVKRTESLQPHSRVRDIVTYTHRSVSSTALGRGDRNQKLSSQTVAKHEEFYTHVVSIAT